MVGGQLCLDRSKYCDLIVACWDDMSQKLSGPMLAALGIWACLAVRKCSVNFHRQRAGPSFGACAGARPGILRPRVDFRPLMQGR